MLTWKSAVLDNNEQREKKREVLLREAAVVFTRRGFHGTSLADIAENLGVTKAALYTYVQSKAELLFLCHSAAMDAAFESLQEALAQGRNGREKIILTLRMYLEKIIGRQSFGAIILEEGTLTPNDTETIIGRRDLFEREMRKLVLEGIVDGSIVRCNPRLVVFGMLGAVNWVLKWYSPDGMWNEKQLAFAMIQFLERALSTQAVEALIEDPATHS
ncbi:TetR family transcriptional regulator [Candidatus Deferrimicrobium sp.]|uniref:TetR family transcriptional regulator n=1 Tax=Candidatus Deferrimicrobium sp. TaxID=3060586 RepID=UPI003C3C68CA